LCGALYGTNVFDGSGVPIPGTYTDPPCFDFARQPGWPNRQIISTSIITNIIVLIIYALILIDKNMTYTSYNISTFNTLIKKINKKTGEIYMEFKHKIKKYDPKNKYTLVIGNNGTADSFSKMSYPYDYNMYAPSQYAPYSISYTFS
jgi:hypothetical protein